MSRVRQNRSLASEVGGVSHELVEGDHARARGQHRVADDLGHERPIHSTSTFEQSNVDDTQVKAQRETKVAERGTASSKS